MPQNRPVPRIAYFISPHGFGHAARACAVMEAIHRLDPSMQFDIYGKTPRWFFEDSLSGPWRYHPVVSDVGFVQKTPLEIDLEGTVSGLEQFYPPDSSVVGSLARKIRGRKAGLVVCDIAPIGIAAARAAGVPSVLVENFTWDWLYEPYESKEPRLSRPIRYLRDLFGLADYHVQTEPICRRQENADLVAGPASRKPRMTPAEVRKRLEISGEDKAVLVTMGGIRSPLSSIGSLKAREDIRFIIPGPVRKIRREANLILLPHRSEYFHPDLVAASDAVVGKIGYSTLAETYRAGIPFGYIERKDFRESAVLVSFVKGRLRGLAIDEGEFNGGAWVHRISDLLALPRVAPSDPDSSEKIARFLLGISGHLRPSQNPREKIFKENP